MSKRIHLLVATFINILTIKEVSLFLSLTRAQTHKYAHLGLVNKIFSFTHTHLAQPFYLESFICIQVYVNIFILINADHYWPASLFDKIFWHINIIVQSSRTNLRTDLWAKVFSLPGGMTGNGSETLWHQLSLPENFGW